MNTIKRYNVIYLEFYFKINSAWSIHTTFAAFLWPQTLLSRAFDRMVKSAVSRTRCHCSLEHKNATHLFTKSQKHEMPVMASRSSSTGTLEIRM